MKLHIFTRKYAPLIIASSFLLSACAGAGTMNGMIRGSGKPILIAYTQSIQHDNLQVTMPDGESFTGKAVMANHSTNASINVSNNNFNIGKNYTGTMKAILFGNKGNTMRCDLQYANSSGYTPDGGVGLCETSNGKTIDVQW